MGLPPTHTLFPYTSLFRSGTGRAGQDMIQVGENRPGKVALTVTVDARRAAEPPPHIQDHGPTAGRQFRGERLDADEKAAGVRHAARNTSEGTSCSCEVSEPCMPSSADSRGSVFMATRASDPAGAATTSPIRRSEEHTSE